MKINQKKTFIIILVALLTVTLISAFPQVSAKYKSGNSAYVYFVDRVQTTNGMTYTYQVESGSGSQRIEYWSLKSKAFQYHDVVDASESFVQSGVNLKFPTPYRNEDDRTVKFTLTRQYNPLGIGMIRIQIKVRWMENDWIMGPVMPKA